MTPSTNDLDLYVAANEDLAYFKERVPKLKTLLQPSSKVDGIFLSYKIYYFRSVSGIKTPQWQSSALRYPGMRFQTQRK